MKQYLTPIIAASLVVSALAPAIAFAADPAPAMTAAKTAAPAMLDAKTQKQKDRAIAEIDRRVAALQGLVSRANALQSVPADFKQQLATTVGNQINAFSALKAKIESDTDAATLKTDLKTAVDSYRVYGIFLSQSNIIMAVDRLAALTNMMTIVGAKLQARGQAAAQAGADVKSLNGALTDLGTKITDAKAQVDAAFKTATSLAQDESDKSVVAANNKALADAKSKVETARQDLKAARKDIDMLVEGLKKVNVSGAAPAAQTQTSAPTAAPMAQ